MGAVLLRKTETDAAMPRMEARAAPDTDTYHIDVVYFTDRPQIDVY